MEEHPMAQRRHCIHISCLFPFLQDSVYSRLVSIPFHFISLTSKHYPRAYQSHLQEAADREAYEVGGSALFRSFHPEHGEDGEEVDDHSREEAVEEFEPEFLRAVLVAPRVSPEDVVDRVCGLGVVQRKGVLKIESALRRHNIPGRGAVRAIRVVPLHVIFPIRDIVFQFQRVRYRVGTRRAHGVYEHLCGRAGLEACFRTGSERYAVAGLQPERRPERRRGAELGTADVGVRRKRNEGSVPVDSPLAVRRGKVSTRT